eukprot:TRINITY_DN121562_c0_g1_i1.p1 TRINITY_DN121562_c0_g1~~TRINITY_DN121562_c0_g1_i1.p1  ORF type:complete len:573 (+),score=179.26 TRINITY_DN121562_c0_g1_i1:79-1797(+)
MQPAFLHASSGAAPGHPAALAPSAVFQPEFAAPVAPTVDGPSSSTGLSTVAAGLAGVAVGVAVQSRRSTVKRHGRGKAARQVVQQAEVDATPLPYVDRTTTKELRRTLTKSEKYFRFNKTQLQDAMEKLIKTSGSDLLKRIRENGFKLTLGDVTFVLAESYGFCWGVERTLAMAYEARSVFPEKTIWITNEIIHNAVVNRDMANMGMKFVPKGADGGKDFGGLNEGDVCILPAFGASIDEMALLKEKNVEIVDTTCPWVSKVWNSVEKGKDKGHTTIIHGKYAHEETIATKSFASSYLVVKDLKEAEYACDYMLGKGGSKDEFMQKFAKAMSEGFDPDRDLDRVGVVNQTTMLKGDTQLIGRLFERALIRKFGSETIAAHFVHFDTICDATQERQDAMYNMFGAQYEEPTSKLYADLEGEQVGVELLSTKKDKNKKDSMSSKEMEAASRGGAAEGVPKQSAGDVNLVLVVGGFNSSNTTHLLEIPQELGVPTYHIDCAERISGDSDAANVIQHKPLSTPPSEAMMDLGLEVTEDFLPEGPLTIGVTSGASTPDSLVEACLRRVLAIRGVKLD